MWGPPQKKACLSFANSSYTKKKKQTEKQKELSKSFNSLSEDEKAKGQ